MIFKDKPEARHYQCCFYTVELQKKKKIGTTIEVIGMLKNLIKKSLMFVLLSFLTKDHIKAITSLM